MWANILDMLTKQWDETREYISAINEELKRKKIDWIRLK